MRPLRTWLAGATAALAAALAAALVTTLAVALLLTPAARTAKAAGATGAASAAGATGAASAAGATGAASAATANGSHRHDDPPVTPARTSAAASGTAAPVGAPQVASPSAGVSPAGVSSVGVPLVGVAERLGQQADLDVTLVGEDGAQLRLGDLVTMPTLLAPVYYSCPNECNVLLGTLASALPQVGLTPGRDYQVLAVSFDERDTPATATKRKGDFLNAGALSGSGGFPPQAWRFLTGDAANVRRLMDSIGFGYQRAGDAFKHSVVLVALSPSGKITRYLYGIKPLPFDLAMAATEAAGGRTGLSIQRAVAMCYTYDPEGRRYVFDIMKVAGASVLTALGLFGLFLAFGGRKRGRGPKDQGPQA